MRTQSTIYTLVLSAILCAIGIMIPMFSPLKLILPTMSFTLGSHVVIFIGMFISVKVGVAVSLGTTIGFFFGGFPPSVVARALSHIVFATIGGFWIKKYPNTIKNRKNSIVFSFVLAIVHAIFEVLAIIPFYFTNALSPLAYDNGFLYSVLLLIGFGTIAHSIVDFEIALFINNAILRRGKNRVMPV